MSDIYELWNRQSGQAKGLMVLGLALIIAMFIGGAYWAMAPQYGVLFDNLEEQDVATISGELERLGYDYIPDGSGAIKVPEDILHEARLSIMETGIPVKGVAGFELFDNSDFGMTEFAQRINYQRALEGELTRTIMALEAVKWARVHLVMPERKLFTEDDKGATGSVTLFVRDGYTLSEKQVQGIQRLVASSVRELEPNRVTVLDQNGATLSVTKSPDDAVSGGTERLELAQEIEKHLSVKAEKALAAALGGDTGGSAFVNVDLNFDKITKKTQSVIPAEDGKNLVRKRQTSSKAGAAKQGKKSTTSTEVEYQLGKELEEIIQATGTIRRLSIAVVIPVSVSGDTEASVKELIKRVVGFDAARGDEITVSRVRGPAATEAVAEAAGDPGKENAPLAPPLEPSPQADSIFSLRQLQGPWLWLGLFSSMLLLSALGYKFGRGKREGRELSVEEREAIVEDLTAWVKQRQQTVS